MRILIIALVFALSCVHLTGLTQVPPQYTTVAIDCESEPHTPKDQGKDPTHHCSVFLLCMDLAYCSKQPTDGSAFAAAGFQAPLFKPPIVS